MNYLKKSNEFMNGSQVNSIPVININLIMKEDKKKIFKELIINYLIEQISKEKQF